MHSTFTKEFPDTDRTALPERKVLQAASRPFTPLTAASEIRLLGSESNLFPISWTVSAVPLIDSPPTWNTFPSNSTTVELAAGARVRLPPTPVVPRIVFPRNRKAQSLPRLPLSLVEPSALFDSVHVDSVQAASAALEVVEEIEFPSMRKKLLDRDNAPSASSPVIVFPEMSMVDSLSEPTGAKEAIRFRLKRTTLPWRKPRVYR